MAIPRSCNWNGCIGTSAARFPLCALHMKEVGRIPPEAGQCNFRGCCNRAAPHDGALMCMACASEVAASVAGGIDPPGGFVIDDRDREMRIAQLERSVKMLLELAYTDTFVDRTRKERGLPPIDVPRAPVTEGDVKSALAKRVCKASRAGRTVAPCDYDPMPSRCGGCDRILAAL